MSSKSPLQTKKKGFTMPHTFVILVVIILIAVVLTWIIPSGEYARVEDLVSGKKVVDATSFSYVENVRVSLLAVPMLIINAFSANADLITLILLSGGAIHMLTAVGALHAKGGRNIIAVKSIKNTKQGVVSSINAQLPLGSVVTLSRNDLDCVVTEYGIAYMRGRTVRQRVNNLIAVAHPDFRAQLRKDAERLLLW